MASQTSVFILIVWALVLTWFPMAAWYTALCTAVNRFPSQVVHHPPEIFRTLFAMKGYGPLIARARDAAGLDDKQLAERLNRTPTTVRRILAEETEPSVEQINALVAALPISAEELLRAMGVNLTLPAAARLPRQLVDALAKLTPDQQQVILTLVNHLAKAGGRE